MSRFLHAALAVASVVAGLSTSVHAQKAAIDPARLAAAKELMAAQGGIEQAQKALDQMTIAMVNQVRQASPAEADGLKRFMETHFSPKNAKVTAYFNDVLDASTEFYAERCTVEELKQMTAFMQTPTGKKFVLLAPELGAVMAPRLIKFQQEVVGEIQAAAQRGDFKK